MKAIRLHDSSGDPSALSLDDLPIPEIRSPGDVLVRVHAADVNPIDFKLRKKGSLFPENLPAVPGCEGAGTVEAVGKGVTSFSPGDQVYFMHGGFGLSPGSFAEYTIVPEISLCKKPSLLTMEEAACVPLTLTTAWESLHTRAQIKQTDTVLIHAGTGGVGQMAIRLAHSEGARVFTTVRGNKNKQIILSQQDAIPISSEHFEEEFLEISNGQHPNLILDTLGGPFTSRSLAFLAPYGRMVTLLEEPLSNEDSIHSKVKNLTLHWIQALAPGIFNIESKKRDQAEILQKGQVLADAGKISVKISRTLSLEDVAEAIDLVEFGHPFGRVVISMGVKEAFDWQHTS